MAEKTVTEILEALARIETDVRTIAKNAADHEARLRVLEGKSGKRMEQITVSVITAVLVGLVGYALGKVF